MGHLIESDALGELGRTLGIAGAGGTTLLDTGNVSQVLPLEKIIRRSRTPGITGGWFHCVILNEHAGAGALSRGIDPYAPGEFAVAPYPATVRPGFDFWLLGAGLARTSGSGALDGAVLSINPADAQQGWGVDDSGAILLSSIDMVIARWTSFDATTTKVHGVAGDGSAWVPLKLRIGRGANIKLVSDVDAAADVLLQMICGLFVSGLGQDVAQ